MQYRYSPYGFNLWDPKSLQGLLQYEVVKSFRIVANDLKIIVGIIKMHQSRCPLCDIIYI